MTNQRTCCGLGVWQRWTAPKKGTTKKRRHISWYTSSSATSSLGIDRREEAWSRSNGCHVRLTLNVRWNDRATPQIIEQKQEAPAVQLVILGQLFGIRPLSMPTHIISVLVLVCSSFCSWRAISCCSGIAHAGLEDPR